MKVQLHLNDKDSPMNNTEIEGVMKVEYKYSKTLEKFLVYLESDLSFITIQIDEIESIEIKEK